MNTLSLTNFALKRPWLVLGLTLVFTVVFGIQFPKVNFDNDPENMLAADEPVRLYHHEVKETFALYDFVIVGVVNEQHEDGIFNVDTLGKIHTLTQQLNRLHQSEAGLPAVAQPGPNGEIVTEIDLRPQDTWSKLLNFAFRHDPNGLFDGDGNPGMVLREIIAPSVVDNIKQAEHNSLKIAYLMEEAPTTREEALVIRDDAMNNPLYKGTLVSEDAQAICLYLPITEKHYSYNVAQLVRHLTADWQGDDQLFITGLPVAEDTFGVEMLVQMATSAPMAGVAIFLLLWLFFKRISLIIAPMLVALFSIIFTMGLLIGLGFDVHIMSSMIAIFLMPIAVADAVHILSEFYDTYPRFKDKAKTIRHVVGHLFMPMFFTSLTTMAGFASLATTPIPPVKVFGLHVAFGVFTAWFLTMTLIPAYIMLFVPKKSLESLELPIHDDQPAKTTLMARFLTGLGAFSYKNAKLIVAATVLVLSISVWGISRIEVNDNPVNWFTPDHQIRVADRVLNHHFGGTYTAYITLHAPKNATPVEADPAAWLKAQMEDSPLDPSQKALLETAMAEVQREGGDYFAQVTAALRAGQEDDAALLQLADEINYLDPEGLTLERLGKAPELQGLDQTLLQTLLTNLGGIELTGEALIEAALTSLDAMDQPAHWLEQTAANFGAPLFKQPAVLGYVADLQAAMAQHPKVGKTSSAVDAVKKAHYELKYMADLDAIQNKANYSIPNTPAGVAQVYTNLEGMKKKDTLFHLVTRDYDEINTWVQLRSGDNVDMESVHAMVGDWLADNPAPTALEAEWAGLTYINVVWQDKMVRGMLNALVSSFVVVLLMMMLLFRSPMFGVLAMIPLTVTITFIYGLIGIMGKEYDMPVAVLSSLTLGLSVDFAIHFLQRSRELQKQHGSWQTAVTHMFREPAAAISRNAVTISIGFTPLLLAPLVPYKTVGFFLATIMVVSWMATLFILAALATLMRRRLFPGESV